MAILYGRAGRLTTKKLRFPARAGTRFFPAVVQAREMIARGDIGEVLQVSPGRVCHFKSYNPNLNALKGTYYYICY